MESIKISGTGKTVYESNLEHDFKILQRETEGLRERVQGLGEIVIELMQALHSSGNLEYWPLHDLSERINRQEEQESQAREKRHQQ